MSNIPKTQYIIAGALFLLAAITATVWSLSATPRSEGQGSPKGPEYMLKLAADDYTSYTHPVYHFSFRYPKNFMLSAFQEESGYIVLVENPEVPMGFQIFVSPFDEAGPVTKERVARDLPSLVMENIVEFLVADNTPALRFSSRDPSLGETREIWFIRDGNLYQISMYAENKEWLDAWVRELAKDFRFKES